MVFRFVIGEDNGDLSHNSFAWLLSLLWSSPGRLWTDSTPCAHCQSQHSVIGHVDGHISAASDGSGSWSRSRVADSNQILEIVKKSLGLNEAFRLKVRE